jgi:Ser/Thr protein kinase RdoA (MazF antagonist)
LVKAHVATHQSKPARLFCQLPGSTALNDSATISDVAGAVTPELSEVGTVSGEAVAERKDVTATRWAPERIRLTSDDVETPAAAAKAQIALDD